jgi:hypothetical protein
MQWDPQPGYRGKGGRCGILRPTAHEKRGSCRGGQGRDPEAGEGEYFARSGRGRPSRIVQNRRAAAGKTVGACVASVLLPGLLRRSGGTGAFWPAGTMYLRSRSPVVRGTCWSLVLLDREAPEPFGSAVPESHGDNVSAVLVGQWDQGTADLLVLLAFVPSARQGPCPFGPSDLLSCRTLDLLSLWPVGPSGQSVSCSGVLLAFGLLSYSAKVPPSWSTIQGV